MQQQRVAVARLFLFSMRALALALCVLLSVGLWAQSLVSGVAPQQYIAPVRVHTVEELSNLLREAEQLPRDNAEPAQPVMFVLHGDEARSFIRGNYQANQSLVDKSAKLTALGIVQIEICERWMGANGLNATQLQPFVKTVRYAPARITELKNAGYIYF